MKAIALMVCCSGLWGATPDDSRETDSSLTGGLPRAGDGLGLLAGEAVFDEGAEELRFTFTFADDVYPADDWGHVDRQLWGYVDIDLDVPPVEQWNSNKSALSGYSSGLGIEAFVHLGTYSGGMAGLFDSAANRCADVPVSFTGPEVVITVDFDSIPGGPPTGDSIAYAAYFYDFLQSKSAVFPEGDGHALSVPEPALTGLLAFAMGTIACGRRGTWRSQQQGCDPRVSM